MQVASTNSGSTQEKTTQTGLKTLGKDDFLKLLITQVRYQDPLKPTEDKEFIAQLAQFSSLEQMQNLNKAFTDLATLEQNLFASSAMNQAVSLIGKNVEGTMNGTDFKGKVEGMKIVDGIPKVLVNGKEITLSSINKITLPEEKAEVSA